MSDATDPEDMADRVADLEQQLSALQTELKRRERSRGPRIPTPREVLRATDDHAIPALIAILEAHIHALRLFQRTIRLLAPPASSNEREPTRSPTLRRATRSLASQLDDLLADLDAATENTESSRLDPLIEEARAIRGELGALADTAGAPDDPGEPDEGNTDHVNDAETDPDATSPIDVDAELRSIKSEMEDDVDPPRSDNGDEDHLDDGSSAADSG